MNRYLKLGILTLIAVLGLAYVSNEVYAHQARYGSDFDSERRQQHLEVKAEHLGIGVEELIQKLETQTYYEIAEELGYTQDDLHLWMKEHVKQRLEDRGWNEEDIQEKLVNMQERYESGECNHSQMKKNFRKEFRNIITE